ncbi:Rieske (2Fe-2S) protein [Pirellulaceae bacterium SH467]
MTSPQRFFVAKTTEIPANEGRAFPIANRMIAVFQYEGEFHAMDDFCPHMGASLAGGCLERGTVACPWHGWQFSLKDGGWIENPKIKSQVYPVIVEGDDVFVEVVPD